MVGSVLNWVPWFLALGVLFAPIGWAPSGAIGNQAQGQGGEGFRVERFERRVPVHEEGSVEISNYFGDVRVRRAGASGTEAVIAAVIQQFDGEPMLRLEAKQVGRLARVRVYESGRRAMPGERVRRRADIVVFVPEETTVSVRADSGLVDVRKTNGSVLVDTNSGEVKLINVDGAVRVKAGAADISITIAHGGPFGPQVLETTSGDISLYVTDDSLLNVTVETAGLIATDYSMAVRQLAQADAPTGPRKMATIEVGKPLNRMLVKSSTGNVTLSRRLLGYQARSRAR